MRCRGGLKWTDRPPSRKGRQAGNAFQRTWGISGGLKDDEEVSRQNRWAEGKKTQV